MDKQEHIPILIQLMYGDKAEMAARYIPERLRRWCAAFGVWHQSRLERSSRESKRAWKGLLSLVSRAPWEITEADVQQYASWLQKQGYANSTIKQRLREVERFYEWCDQHRVDGEEAAVFNPAAGVPKPRVEQYSKTVTLSAVEARNLLEAISSDESILSRRDYAFFLARLLLGVRLKYLLELKWGQIQQGDEGAWILREKGKTRKVRAPEAVWEAIKTYLRASGRLEGIQQEEFIFAPLTDPLHQEASGLAEEWNGKRAIHERSMTKHLKRFGRLAGIPEKKLKLATLRHTATVLRMEAGDDPGQIQEFLGRISRNGTNKYLAHLVGEQDATLGEAIPGGEGLEVNGRENSGIGGQRPAKERKPHRFEPQENITHGLYSKSQPAEDVEALLAENIKDIEQEIEGLRILNQGLWEMAETNQDWVHLAEVSARSEGRLAEMVRANKYLAENQSGGHKDKELRELLEQLAQDFNGSLEEWGVPGSGEVASGGLDKSIARLRLGLRRTLKMATEADNVKERVRYTDLYGGTCIKLIKLLRSQAMEQGSLSDWWREGVDKALEDVVEDLDLRI